MEADTTCMDNIYQILFTIHYFSVIEYHILFVVVVIWLWIQNIIFLSSHHVICMSVVHILPQKTIRLKTIFIIVSIQAITPVSAFDYENVASQHPNEGITSGSTEIDKLQNGTHT